MAVGKEIRTKIKSISSTQKITRAMEMVAASKMRKAQNRASAARPYANKIHQVIEHLSKAHSEFQHPYLEAKAVKRIGIIVVSTDRGLCGGLNINLFRRVLDKVKECKDQDIEVCFATIGSRAESFFRRLGGKVIASKANLGEEPELSTILGPIKVMLSAFCEDDVQAVYLMHNDFVNTMTQTPRTSTLLPISKVEQHEAPKKHGKHWDYIYEPNSIKLLDVLLNRYIESQVYHAVVDNVACEQAARMIAMKSASDNAGEIIDSLQLSFNKARQAAITQELSEIVSGASAV